LFAIQVPIFLTICAINSGKRTRHLKPRNYVEPILLDGDDGDDDGGDSEVDEEAN
jgi:hypothetical protein